MSGHSKWHSIKHKKGAADAKRGKIFTKHAKLITIAARDGGGDAEMNPALRTAIANAKADNTPNSNIEKAIKKGTGEDKEGANFVEVMYEGFGPGSTVFYVQVITDNKNRSLTNVKTAFSKNGGNLGEAGTVGWMFERKGVILAKAPEIENDEAELLIIDSGAENFESDGDYYEVTTEPAVLMQVREILEKSGFQIEKAELSFIPKNRVEISDLEEAKRVIKLAEVLEDDEDVSEVYGNYTISENLLEKLGY